MKKRLIAALLCISITGTGVLPVNAAVQTEEIVEEKTEKVAEEVKSGIWSKVYEAEDGLLEGSAQIESPANLGGAAALVSNLDGGENVSSVTITVNAEKAGDVQMKVKYRSGDDRDLCYRVNEGDVKQWKNLNSGNWETMAETESHTIRLESGENRIKFFASDNCNGPGIDFITLSGTGDQGGSTENPGEQKELTVTFKAEGIEDVVLSKNFTDTIDISEVPKAPVKEGMDFLGWFWGPESRPTKYEGIFPLKLSTIPENIRTQLNNNIVFTARFGHNTPANGKDKAGYRLIFNDDFNGTSLDESKWVDKYLSSWSKTSDFTKGREIKDGIMSLQITDETQPWCPEFDGATVISGFTTGQRNGLHNWNRSNKVRNPEDTQLTHINQYGYYEMRAKGQSGSSRHSAWWLLGFEDIPEESAEIDIFEVLGKNNSQVPPAVHKWNDKDAFKEGSLSALTDRGKDFNNEYHVYGFDWQEGTGSSEQYPDKIVLYVDGEKYTETDVNIDYPMIQLLSLYEKRKGGWTGNWEWMPYPNTMDVDYVRVYKKLPENVQKDTQNGLTITKVKAEDLNIPHNEIYLETYGDYTEKNLKGTKSYVRVEWSDGIETQEPVVWEPITEENLTDLRNGKTIVKNGTVKISSLPGEVKTVQTSMTIIPEEAPPYSSEGLKGGNLKLLFDGEIDGIQAGSAEFTRVKEEMEADKVSIIYDFKKDVILSGVDMWTNFGAKQGIKAFKTAVWNEKDQTWDVIKENEQDKIFTLDWVKEENEPMEKQGVEFPEVTTSKVKLILNDVGYAWGKFAMREIQFRAEEPVVLTEIEVKAPEKTEYTQGEELDLTGMTVLAKYSDGTSLEVPADQAVVSGYDANTPGDQTITVTYENKTAYFMVKVNPIQEVINGVPVIHAEDQVLTVGDEFDPLNLVTASDEEDGDLTSAVQIVENTVDTSKAGDYIVTYKVEDSKGAAATKTIKVVVKDKTVVPPDENDKPGTDKPGTDKPGTDKPGTDKPGTDKPGTDKPGTDKPGTDKPGTDKPGTDKPNNSKPDNNKVISPNKNANQTTGNKPGSVKTGDETHLGLWFSLLAVSGTAFTILKVRKRKKTDIN